MIDTSTDSSETSSDLACGPLVQLFNRTFADSSNTRLLAGGEEPLYLPAGVAEEGLPAEDHHRIVFTRDYFASALHEVAHWCVAGAERRLQLDYGYWYLPDGRNAEQQQTFELVEVKPQALEWLFSVASGQPFKVSADNLTLGQGPSEQFKSRIHQQALDHCRNGVNSRARAFADALAAFYGTANAFDPVHYDRNRL